MIQLVCMVLAPFELQMLEGLDKRSAQLRQVEAVAPTESCSLFCNVCRGLASRGVRPPAFSEIFS